jgi:transcriptional regulator with XRE-family HTH domain
MSPAAKLIRHFREKRGYHQKTAMYLLNVRQGYLSDVENGKKALIGRNLQ